MSGRERETDSDRDSDRKTDKQTDRQTDRDSDRQSDRETERQIQTLTSPVIIQSTLAWPPCAPSITVLSPPWRASVVWLANCTLFR